MTDTYTCELIQMEPLPGATAVNFQLEGDWVAGALGGSLHVWKGTTLVNSVNTSISLAGYPVIGGSRVYWSNGWLDLKSGQFKTVVDLKAILMNGTGMSIMPPGHAYRPVVTAWSEDGSAFIICGSQSAYPNLPGTRILMMAPDGQVNRILYEGNEIAPNAIYFGRKFIAAGMRGLRVFDLAGNPMCEMGEGPPALRLACSANADRLIAVEGGKITLWETKTWDALAIYEGLWTDADLSADGGTIMAIGFGGRLFCIDTDTEGSPVLEMDVGAAMQSVTLNREFVVGTFLSGAAVRKGKWKKTGLIPTS